MSNDQPLNGLVAVVTGATSEAGRRQTLALANAGARVVLVGRRIEMLEVGVDEVRSLNAPAKFQCADLTCRKALPTIARRISEQFGRVDILVNTARFDGVLPSRSILDWEHDAATNPNVVLPFLLAQELVPYMKTGRHGRIVNTTSATSLKAYDNGLAYGAASAGIVQTTKTMAQAWSRHGITSNTIAVGRIQDPAIRSQFTNANLVQSLTGFENPSQAPNQIEFDAMTRFLASKASANLNGHIIYGCTAQTRVHEQGRAHRTIHPPAAISPATQEIRATV